MVFEYNDLLEDVKNGTFDPDEWKKDNEAYLRFKLRELSDKLNEKGETRQSRAVTMIKDVEVCEYDETYAEAVEDVACEYYADGFLCDKVLATILYNVEEFKETHETIRKCTMLDEMVQLCLFIKYSDEHEGRENEDYQELGEMAYRFLMM